MSFAIDPRVADFNAYFGIAENNQNPQRQALSTGIRESVLAFYNVLDLDVSVAPPSYEGVQPSTALPLPAQYPQRPAQYPAQAPDYYQGPLNQEIHIHNHNHGISNLNNILFWTWIGSNRQPRYRTYHHRSVGSALTMRAGQMMAVAGSGHTNNAGRKNNEDEAKKKIFLMVIGLALADIVAAVAAIYVTVVAIKQASDAKTQANRFNQIAHSMQPDVNVPYAGDPNNDPTLNLQEIGRNLKEIGNREAKCSKYRAISIAALAIAGVGAVHVACSAIACAIITGSASLSVSASGIAALAFFSASCAPPVLLAVATIAALGTVIYLVLRGYDKKAKDRHNAQDGLIHLNTLTQLALNKAPPAYQFVAPSAPPMPPPAYEDEPSK